ncbi:hypothetical protein FAIPA1_590009 [Frankia sp. AiPs1]
MRRRGPEWCLGSSARSRATSGPVTREARSLGLGNDAEPAPEAVCHVTTGGAGLLWSPGA